jgi:hypothetical protein
MDPFVLSIEPFHGATYQHGFHLGTVMRVAMQFAADLLAARRARSIALLQSGRIVATYAGEWNYAPGYCSPSLI